MNQQDEMNTTVLRVFLWSGVVLVGALIVAQGYLMGFLPGISPALSAKETAQIFIDRKDSILIGCLLQCMTWCLYGTWAIPIIMFIRKAERGMPVLTYASLVNVGGGWVFFILIPMTWAVIAFRAETLDPLHMALILGLDVHYRGRHFHGQKCSRNLSALGRFFQLLVRPADLPGRLDWLLQERPFRLRWLHFILVCAHRLFRLDGGHDCGDIPSHSRS
jgi:hypothetical protein